MKQKNDKLSQVFNSCAGKIFDLEAVQDDMLGILKSLMTKSEMDSFEAISSQGARGPEELLSFVKEKMDDGSMGMYMSDRNVFAHIKLIQYAVENGFLIDNFPADIAQKVSDAAALAIERAEDHRNDLKQGLIQPFRGFDF